LVVSTAITGVGFMLLHGAGDPWLNAFYLYFGVLACVLTWRTGGLEAAIALHVVNNLAGLAWVPFTGIEGLFDREAGVGDPAVLLQMAIVTLVAAGLLWLGSRAKLTQSAGPGVALGTQGQAAAAPDGE
jgi:membrane protease YdiL (CAAX protease family)